MADSLSVYAKGCQVTEGEHEAGNGDGRWFQAKRLIRYEPCGMLLVRVGCCRALVAGIWYFARYEDEGSYFGDQAND